MTNDSSLISNRTILTTTRRMTMKRYTTCSTKISTYSKWPLRTNQDDGRDSSIADVPVRLTKDELLEAQSTDDFCLIFLSRKSRSLDRHFFEGNGGLLRRNHPNDPEIFQIVLRDGSDRIDISAKRITGRRWPVMYTKLSATIRTVRRTA